MPAKVKYLPWVDLETAGLDEHNDPILEIGLVITPAHAPFDQLVEYEAVINPDPVRWNGWRDRLPGGVVRMHTINGLLAEVGPKGRRMEEVEEEIVTLLGQYGKKGQFLIAGSGVGHFDHLFIKAQMPRFAEWLQYGNLDVGCWRRGITYAGRKDLVAFGETFSNAGGKPHRGLLDVKDHLNEWRSYAAFLQNGIETF